MDIEHSTPMERYGESRPILRSAAPTLAHVSMLGAFTTSGQHLLVVVHYEGRRDCRKPASFAVALYCGIGSSSLKALVKAFDRLHMVRAWNSSCTG